MKTMNDYTIYCTPEQTIKALELGASIMTFGYGDLGDAENEVLNMNRQAVLSRNADNSIIVGQIPTAEQLIGWLEKDYFGSIEISKYGDNSGEWGYRIYDKSMTCILYKNNIKMQLYSRPEATLAAIDAALEYLSNNKL